MSDVMSDDKPQQKTLLIPLLVGAPSSWCMFVVDNFTQSYPCITIVDPCSPPATCSRCPSLSLLTRILCSHAPFVSAEAHVSPLADIHVFCQVLKYARLRSEHKPLQSCEYSKVRPSTTHSGLFPPDTRFPLLPYPIHYVCRGRAAAPDKSAAYILTWLVKEFRKDKHRKPSPRSYQYHYLRSFDRAFENPANFRNCLLSLYYKFCFRSFPLISRVWILSQVLRRKHLPCSLLKDAVVPMPTGRTKPKKPPPLVSSSKVYQQLLTRPVLPRRTKPRRTKPLRIAKITANASPSTIEVKGVKLTRGVVSFASIISDHAKGHGGFNNELKQVHRNFRDKPDMCETTFRDTLCEAFEKKHIIDNIMPDGLRKALQTYQNHKKNATLPPPPFPLSTISDLCLIISSMTSHGLCVLRRSGHNQLVYAYSGGYCLLTEYTYKEQTLPTSTEALRDFIVNNGACEDDQKNVKAVTAEHWLLVFLYEDKWYIPSLHQSRVEVKRPHTANVDDVDVKICEERAIMFGERFAGYGHESLQSDNHDLTLSVATLLAAVRGIMRTPKMQEVFTCSFEKLKGILPSTAQSNILAIANATGAISTVQCTAKPDDPNAQFTCWLESNCETCKEKYVTFTVQSSIHFKVKGKLKQITLNSESNLYRVTHSIYIWTFYGTVPLSLQSVDECKRSTMKNLLVNSLPTLSTCEDTRKRHTELLCEILICLMCYAEYEKEPLSDDAITAVCKLCELPVLQSVSTAQYHIPFTDVGQVPTSKTYTTHFNKDYSHTGQAPDLKYLDNSDRSKGL